MSNLCGAINPFVLHIMNEETQILTVMFTDIVGSVKMYSKVTDQVAANLVRNLDKQVVELLPQHKGQYINSTGDGHLLAFEGSTDAVRCADDIHTICAKSAKEIGHDVFLRIAIHTGPIMQGKGDIHGNTVNLAARLMTISGPQETSVSEQTWIHLSPEDRNTYIPHGPEVFKGFTRFTNVYKKPSSITAYDTTVRATPWIGYRQSRCLANGML